MLPSSLKSPPTVAHDRLMSETNTRETTMLLPLPRSSMSAERRGGDRGVRQASEGL